MNDRMLHCLCTKDALGACRQSMHYAFTHSYIALLIAHLPITYGQRGMQINHQRQCTLIELFDTAVRGDKRCIKNDLLSFSTAHFEGPFQYIGQLCQALNPWGSPREDPCTCLKETSAKSGGSETIWKTKRCAFHFLLHMLMGGVHREY